MLDSSENNGTEEIGLVAPTPGFRSSYSIIYGQLLQNVEGFLYLDIMCCDHTFFAYTS